MESKKGGASRQDIEQYEGRMTYHSSDKPLDFSFMYIKHVACKFNSFLY